MRFLSAYVGMICRLPSVRATMSLPSCSACSCEMFRPRLTCTTSLAECPSCSGSADSATLYLRIWRDMGHARTRRKGKLLLVMRIYLRRGARQTRTVGPSTTVTQSTTNPDPPPDFHQVLCVLLILLIFHQTAKSLSPGGTECSRRNGRFCSTGRPPTSNSVLEWVSH